ncbi:MAG: heparinase II/III domain-containing protein [Gemmatimonadales bacterium]
MLSQPQLDTLSESIATEPALADLLRTIERRAARVRDTMPVIPRVKALLSRDGGVCPNDGTALGFDPWSPDRHRCPRCGAQYSGDRHHRHWARTQHLWLAERAVDLALVAGLRNDARARDRALEILAAYQSLYFETPNRDNVLGPSHLFFSTYLESLWVTSYLAAAHILRAAEALPAEHAEGVGRVAEEAANLIGEFNEGLSNRQAWHAAALTAIAVWFDDAELLATAIEDRTGLLGLLADGFAGDGLWWEGENYHLFALRGIMLGLHWAGSGELPDLLEDPDVREHFRTALLAPAHSALPDFTYPARGDSRYGVSLAHPAFLELWEVGRAWLDRDRELGPWLAALYAVPNPPLGDVYDAWLHDAGLPDPPAHRRAGLSSWALTAIRPEDPKASPWTPTSTIFKDQGLAIVRDQDRYVSLECGPATRGHGHPDRLHLTVHAGGIHWLPDPGTGSYVHRSLAWYRSPLAHNAPILDGLNAGGADAWCAGFDASTTARGAAPWAWVRGKAGGLTRTVVFGPDHLLDLVELESEEPHELVLPCHVQGNLVLETEGEWEPAEFSHPFVSAARRDVPRGAGARTLRIRARGDGSALGMVLLAPGAELLLVEGPGLPTDPNPAPFVILRDHGSRLRWLTVLDFLPNDPERAVTNLSVEGDSVHVGTRARVLRYRISEQGVDGERVMLRGTRPPPRRPTPLFQPQLEPEAQAVAPRVAAPPALDGTLQGFETGAPLTLDAEHQYRRSEAPYDPDRFAAEAWVNWDGDAGYLAVRVRKPELVIRPQDAPPLDLDNEPEDINGDGLQLYLRHQDQTMAVLVSPQPDGSVTARAIGAAAPTVSGRWSRAPDGYLITLRLAHPLLEKAWSGARLGFDLLVNEMRPDRMRRAGQLVWSGGNGWIYLRGDRQDPALFGILELG